MDKFFTTKLTCEITIETQFGPANSINMIDVLTRVPAIKGLNIIKLETDYKNIYSNPRPLDENWKAIRSIPCKIR